MENDVAATARTTASIRARETARPDGLIRDPLAEVLAGPEAMAALRAMPEDMQDRSSRLTILRTHVFDDWLTSTVGSMPGVAQVVLLGAGFDSRAFRLDWPPGIRLWELDQAPLLAAKAAILAGVAATAGCQRTPVAVDFATPDWPAALASAGCRADLPTAWLAEGLLPYLPPEVAVGLLDATRQLSAAGSVLAADIVDEDAIVTRNQYLAGLRQLSPALKGAPFQFGANDPQRLLAEHGWTVASVVEPSEVARKFSRFTVSPPQPNLPLPRLSFVLARRADG